MDCGEGWAYHSGFGCVVKSAYLYVSRNVKGQLPECLNCVHGHKIVCADDDFRLFLPLPEFFFDLLNRVQSAGIKRNVQLVLYMPNFISVIVVCGMVRIMLSVTGPVNNFLGTQINFMTSPDAFRSIYIASGIWQGAGWGSIMYTAALANVNHETREAAILDGANILQEIRVVEWPAIKNIVIIQFILQAGNIMSIGFEKAFALQTDLNLSSAEIIATYVYRKGLLDGDYSFSTAVGLFNTVINVIMLLIVNKTVSKLNDDQGL